MVSEMLVLSSNDPLYFPLALNLLNTERIPDYGKKLR